MTRVRATMILLALAVVAACVGTASLPFLEGVGFNPRLPPARKELILTVHLAPARGWPEGAKPAAAAGLAVTRFAANLSHPCWVHVLPNGDVLVAETNAPPRPEEGKGVNAMVMQFVMKRAGAGVPSANRITLRRNTDGDGIAETCTAFLENLNSPFGMALIGTELFVANSDAVMRFPYTPGATHIDGPGTRLTDLPAGPRNHHWTKNIIASRDGAKLYATVGSNSIVAEHGMAEEEGRAAIWEIDVNSGAKRQFASGLRNPNGLGWQPASGTLWTVMNERDELGSDLVPDYVTSVCDAAFYGWPYSYYGGNVEARVEPPRCRPHFASAPSSARTGRGVAGRAAATTWYSCHLRRDGPLAIRSTYCRDS